jgi:hypothetical protein
MTDEAWRRAVDGGWDFFLSRLVWGLMEMDGWGGGLELGSWNGMGWDGNGMGKGT